MSNKASAREESGLVPVYMVELLLERPATLDREALVASLRAKLGNVVALGDDPKHLQFACEDFPVTYADGARMGGQLVIAEVPAPTAESLGPVLQQTWDWDGARDAVARAKHALLVSDFMAAGLAPADRLRLVPALVAAVLEQTSAVAATAIHWKPGQRLIDPTDFGARYAEDPIRTLVNVRMFNIADRLPGETVMDTLGLAAVGLPDFQIHFVGLDPGRVAGFLYAMSRYVHQRGPVIEDGHTVPGPKPGEKWQVRMERALVDPGRVVLDVEPNEPHSARGKSA
jgi:hypothetical protein